jgi:hypothetical protein
MTHGGTTATSDAFSNALAPIGRSSGGAVGKAT